MRYLESESAALERLYGVKLDQIQKVQDHEQAAKERQKRKAERLADLRQLAKDAAPALPEHTEAVAQISGGLLAIDCLLDALTWFEKYCRDDDPPDERNPAWVKPAQEMRDRLDALASKEDRQPESKPCKVPTAPDGILHVCTCEYNQRLLTRYLAGPPPGWICSDCSGFIPRSVAIPGNDVTA